jgi:N4-gp56 family major capsid protein
MATYPTITDSIGTSDAGNFIPELWSDEVLAAYKANLVLPQLVTNMPFSGKKGDTVHIPRPTRGSATAKAAATGVTLIAESNTAFDLTIDQHFEYSRLIEDIASIQALDSMRQFYTDDAGYALATVLDDALHTEGAKFAAPDASPTVAGSAYSKAVIGSDGSTVWDGSANTNTGNGAALADAGIRTAIQALDDNNVPMRMRALVIPPVEKNNLLGLDRFTEQAFVGEVGAGNSIRNGLIGDVYGIPVYVSTNCATVAADDTTTNYRACLLFQKEAVVMAEQLSPRTQTQYKQEYLSDLFTADTIYGVGTMRPEAGVAIIVPA